MPITLGNHVCSWGENRAFLIIVIKHAVSIKWVVHCYHNRKAYKIRVGVKIMMFHESNDTCSWKQRNTRRYTFQIEIYFDIFCFYFISYSFKGIICTSKLKCRCRINEIYSFYFVSSSRHFHSISKYLWFTTNTKLSTSNIFFISLTFSLNILYLL
jgi:hypothetical protein